MSDKYAEYKQVKEDILDAPTLDERFAHNVKGLAILMLMGRAMVLDKSNTSTSLKQIQAELIYHSTEFGERVNEIVDLYVELYHERDMRWEGFDKGLVRKRRPGLATERD